MRIQKDIYHHELVKRGSGHVTAASKAVAARGNVHPGCRRNNNPCCWHDCSQRSHGHSVLHPSISTINYRIADPAYVMSYLAFAFYNWVSGPLRLNRLAKDKWRYRTPGCGAPLCIGHPSWGPWLNYSPPLSLLLLMHLTLKDSSKN